MRQPRFCSNSNGFNAAWWAPRCCSTGSHSVYTCRPVFSATMPPAASASAPAAAGDVSRKAAWLPHSQEGLLPGLADRPHAAVSRTMRLFWARIAVIMSSNRSN